MTAKSKGGSRNDPSSLRVPTVSRLAGDTIIELVYDAKARETALAVSRFNGLWNLEQEVRIESGEVLVPYTAANTIIASDCVLLPSMPEHHGSKSELLADIRAYLHRYVDLNPIFLEIAAHYALLSWVYDAFNECPYLRLQGDFGTGKTRALITIGSILYKPVFASGASTVSPIFHILDVFGGSLVLDEADFRFSDAANQLVKILNNGTMRGLPVLRTMQNRDREFNPRAFKVFGPKIVAMRGSYDDDALESRFLSEDMTARTLRDDIPVHLPSALRAEALSLRNRLLHFRFSSLFSMAIDPMAASPGATARINQITLPLLSLVDDLETKHAIQQVATKQAAAIPRFGDLQMTEIIFRALRTAFADANRSTVSVGEITREVNGNPSVEFPYTTKQIGHLIRRRIGIETRKSNGVYVVRRDAVARLAPAQTEDAQRMPRE
ncbi:MAG TPA: hypothetical protein VGI20_04805 [Rhizomicrobium sp.]|jgi:hypothetical protein